MAPELASRMVESEYPSNGSVVMVQVTNIDSDGATVSLLEYNNLEGYIHTATDPDCLKRSRVGRVEPLKVLFVDKNRKYIALQRCTTTFDERMSCEQLYNKRKHVHSVLHSIAEEHDIDLEKLYRRTRWPSYEQLHKLHEADWLVRKLKTKLRTALLARIELMQYFSWRIVAPWILNLCHLIQQLATCWAFALIRQLEATLKLQGKITKEDYLSFQDFINKVPQELLGDDGDIDLLDPLEEVLVVKGVCHKEECPLLHKLKQEPCQAKGRVHKVSTMKVNFDTTSAEYESGMIEELEKCPITASVLWWESFHGVREDKIFSPTDSEKRRFRTTRCKDVSTHIMLLTGHGFNCKGVRFLEFQDCGGDVGNCDRGFVRMARDPNPVIEYVTMT